MKPQEFMDEILRRSFQPWMLETGTLTAETDTQREALQLVALLATLVTRRHCLGSEEGVARWRRDAAKIRCRAAAFLSGIRLSDLM